MSKLKSQQSPFQGRGKKVQRQAPKLDAEGKSKKQRKREKKVKKAIAKEEQEQREQKQKEDDLSAAVDESKDEESVQSSASAPIEDVAKGTPMAVTETENEHPMSVLCQHHPKQQDDLEGPIQVGKTTTLPIRSRGSPYNQGEGVRDQSTDHEVVAAPRSLSPCSRNEPRLQPSISVATAEPDDSKVDEFNDSPASSTSTQTLLDKPPDTMGADVHGPQLPMTVDASQDNGSSAPNGDHSQPQTDVVEEAVLSEKYHAYSRRETRFPSNSTTELGSQYSIMEPDTDAKPHSTFSNGFWISPAIHVSAETDYPTYRSEHELDDTMAPMMDANAITDRVLKDALPASALGDISVTPCPIMVPTSQSEVGEIAVEDAPEGERSHCPDTEKSSDEPLIVNKTQAGGFEAQVTDANTVQNAMPRDSLETDVKKEQPEAEDNDVQNNYVHSVAVTTSTSTASVSNPKGVAGHDTVATSPEHGELKGEESGETPAPDSARTEAVPDQAPIVQPSSQSGVMPVNLSTPTNEEQTAPDKEEEDELETWADLYLPGKSSAGIRPPPSLRVEVFKKLALLGWEGALPWEGV